MMLSLFGTIAAAIGLGFLAVIVTRPTLFQATVAHPFDAVGTSDPAADTLSSEAILQTTFGLNTGWKLVTLNRLSDVEDLLDSLESSHIAEREVHTLGNSSFAVRWR